MLSFFLNIFVGGTLLPLSPGWTSLACLPSLFSQIRFSIPSPFFSALSYSLCGLKLSFENTGHQKNMQPFRPCCRKALSHAFPFFLQKVCLCLMSMDQIVKCIYLKPGKERDNYNSWHMRWLSPCWPPQAPAFSLRAVWSWPFNDGSDCEKLLG